VGDVFRLALRRHLNHFGHLAVADGASSARSRSVFPQRFQTAIEKPVALARGFFRGDAELGRDALILKTFGGAQNNAGAFHQPWRKRSGPRLLLKHQAVFLSIVETQI